VAGQQRLQKDGSPVRIVELGKPADKASAATPSASEARR
jgi:membrane fusion protein (multidrug efflux system)